MADDRKVRLMVLGSALLATVAVALAFALIAAPGIDESSVHYVGAKILPGSPGEGGLPVIPVRVNAAGIIEGIPIHLDWYSYCRPDAPGLDWNAPVSNIFTYSLRPERVQAAEAQGVEVWFKPLLGESVRATDFTEDWQGAHIKWRTPSDKEGWDELNAVVIKIPPGTYSDKVTKEFAPDGFVAFNQDDTHFCCQAGWRLSPEPMSKNREDGFDTIYSSCHDDRYDPRRIESYEMPPGVER